MASACRKDSGPATWRPRRSAERPGRWRSASASRPAPRGCFWPAGSAMSFTKFNRPLAAALALGLAMAATGRAQPPTETAGNALALVPAKAPIVVHIRGWDRSVDRLKAFIKAAVGDFSPQVIGQLE